MTMTATGRREAERKLEGNGKRSEGKKVWWGGVEVIEI